MRHGFADNVADNWAHGLPLDDKRQTISTDGKTVKSYAHVIGVTNNEGLRIAYDCHYSATTAKHCSAIKRVANKIEACPSGHSGNC